MNDLIGRLEQILESENFIGNLDGRGLSHYERAIVRLLNAIINNNNEATEYDIMKYKLANDALGSALWDMDVISTDPVNPNNKFTWSREFRHMLGFSDENDFPNVLKSWSDRLHPDDRERTLNAFAAHITDYTGMTPYNIEYRLMLKNGEYRHFHTFGKTLRDNAGTPLRVAGAVMDINEKKSVENEASEVNERTKFIFDRIPLICMLRDEDNNIIDCNQETLNVFGVSEKSDFININRFYPEFQPDGSNSVKRAKEIINELLEKGSYSSFEWTFYDINGEQFPVEKNLILIKWEGHNYILSCARDLREIKGKLVEIAEREREESKL